MFRTTFSIKIVKDRKRLQAHTVIKPLFVLIARFVTNSNALLYCRNSLKHQTTCITTYFFHIVSLFCFESIYPKFNFLLGFHTAFYTLFSIWKTMDLKQSVRRNAHKELNVFKRDLY